jgi:hypothetical protein
VPGQMKIVVGVHSLIGLKGLSTRPSMAENGSVTVQSLK